MPENELRQTIVDQEHLKLLSMAYLVSAGLNAFFSLFGLAYALFGMFVLTAIAHGPGSPTQGPPAELVAWMFGLVGAGIFMLMVTLGVLKFLVYQRLKQRRSRVFCMIVAGFSCLGVPYGTLLGIFTFSVLARPSVAQLFQESPPRLP